MKISQSIDVSPELIVEVSGEVRSAALRVGVRWGCFQWFEGTIVRSVIM